MFTYPHNTTASHVFSQKVIKKNILLFDFTIYFVEQKQKRITAERMLWGDKKNWKFIVVSLFFDWFHHWLALNQVGSSCLTFFFLPYSVTDLWCFFFLFFYTFLHKLLSLLVFRQHRPCLDACATFFFSIDRILFSFTIINIGAFIQKRSVVFFL